jgi:hypothetical protein
MNRQCLAIDFAPKRLAWSALALGLISAAVLGLAALLWYVHQKQTQLNSMHAELAHASACTTSTASPTCFHLHYGGQGPRGQRCDPPTEPAVEHNF